MLAWAGGRREGRDVVRADASEVIAAGHLCLDILPPLPSRAAIPDPGRTVEVGRLSLSPGGAVANVGLALLRLGIAAELVGNLGDDPVGDLLETLLSRAVGGRPTGVRRVAGQSTSYTLVLTSPETDRAFLHHPGVNDVFDPSRIDPDSLCSARLLYFGYPPLMRGVYRDGGRALAAWLRAVKDRGLLTVLDMTLPDPDGESGAVDWGAFLENVLPHVDAFCPSFDELSFMLDRASWASHAALCMPTGTQRLDRLAKRVLDLGAPIVAIKLGSQGVYLRTGSGETLPTGQRVPVSKDWGKRELWAPSFRVNPVNTTGAGDAAVAGFVTGLLKGWSPEKTLALAAAVGACAVESADAIGGVRSLPDTVRRIRGDWRQTVEAVNDPTWTRHAPTGVFLRAEE